MATPTPPWTPEEENKLRELILSAKSVEAIAKLLNRTPLAVRRRAKHAQAAIAKDRSSPMTQRASLVRFGPGRLLDTGRRENES